MRELARNCNPKNFYKVNESGVFYRIGPSRIYLSVYEDLRSECGSSLQRPENRICMVFGTNSDGAHLIPMKYTGVPAEPECFRDPRFRSSAD